MTMNTKDREAGLRMIYRHTNKEWKGKGDEGRTIRVQRDEKYSMVPLASLTEAEIDNLLPEAMLREEARVSGIPLIEGMQMNDPEYTHYNVCRGKIESGWTCKEDANEYRNENLPEHLKSESKIVHKRTLAQHKLDPENNDHWGEKSDFLKEAVVAQPTLAELLIEGNTYEIFRLAKRRMNAATMHVIRSCDKKLILEHARKPLNEQQDAPDQSGYPLTRSEVQKLLNTWQRHPATGTNNDEIEAHSATGAERVSPLNQNDGKNTPATDTQKDAIASQIRPAHLMPYDYNNPFANSEEGK